MRPIETAADETAPVLSARDVTVMFGGLAALSNVSLEVAPGSITGLVGPNGAGKTTMLGVLSGLVRPKYGRIGLSGDDITHTSPQQRARKGLARTFQHPELFLGLTVREHLVLAYRVRTARRRLWRDMVDPTALWRRAPGEGEHVDRLLELLNLTRIAGAPVAALPLGLGRLVEVGRALASGPRVVLLDEPLAGLDLKASDNICLVFQRLVHQGGGDLSLLIVEHDVPAVLALSSTVYVLDFGERIASGSPEEVRHDPAVRAAYLGDEDGPMKLPGGASSAGARELVE